MTDQKPKIDLKSRLGKKTVSSPSGPSIPPPVGLPRGSGIPAPPFPSRPPSQLDASNPYASLDSGSPPPVQQQAIKVEMSDEVRDAQKKQGKRAIFLAVATALVGGLLGFAVGSGHERGKVADQALRDAGDLGVLVKKAVETSETLADTLKSARDQLSAGKYPEAELNKLGGLRVPFGGESLGGRNIGRFNKELSRGLMGFSIKSEEVNDQVETVQRVLAGSRKSLQDMFSQGATPKVMWAAVADSGGGGGAWISMMRVPEPFLVKPEKDKGWPESLKFKVDGKDVSVKRYTKGDPTGGDPTFLPVDPTSQSAVCPEDTAFRVSRQLQELEDLLRGGKDAAGNDETGMIDAGRALEEKLKALGSGG
jgi:hypothetical protein